MFDIRVLIFPTRLSIASIGDRVVNSILMTGAQIHIRIAPGVLGYLGKIPAFDPVLGNSAGGRFLDKDPQALLCGGVDAIVQLEEVESPFPIPCLDGGGRVWWERVSMARRDMGRTHGDGWFT